MAYFLSEPAPGASDLTAKNRVWGFFQNPNKTHPGNRRQSLQPRREIRPTTTKTASGIPLWPSRDPIGERGGVNLYGFVGNDGVDKWDVLGLRWEMGSWERTQAVRKKVKSHMDLLSQELVRQGKLAGEPANCPSKPKPGDKVLVEFKNITDTAYANMYLTGFFALGGVSVNLIASGEYSYDCCTKKPLNYHVDIDASFSDDFDEVFNGEEHGWDDTGITFVGSWVEQYNGSFK